MWDSGIERTEPRQNLNLWQWFDLLSECVKDIHLRGVQLSIVAGVHNLALCFHTFGVSTRIVLLWT